MKVWIVFEGEYSDRGTVAVFDNETAAKNYLENNRHWDKWGPNLDIEEWDVNTECKLLSERQIWETYMDRRGNAYPDAMGIDRTVDGATRMPNTATPEEPRIFGLVTRQPLLCVKRYAENAEHIIKIANEYRVQMIASGEWDRQVAELEKIYGHR